MTAWLFLDARGRRLFRRELTEFDDAAWARARGWALEISVLALATSYSTCARVIGSVHTMHGLSSP